MMDYPCAVPSLVIVISAVLVLSCGQSQTPLNTGVGVFTKQYKLVPAIDGSVAYW